MQHLCNDTAINVAGLLKVQTGQVREFELALDRFPLDDGLVAVDVVGEIRLTRLRDGIMARVTAAGTVDLECARCLRVYQQPFDIAFSEEYRQTVDVHTGAGAGVEAEVATDEDTARINDNHLLDIGEVLRQEILVALPMRPDCGERCPGPDLAAIRRSGDDEASVDGRLAALARLLEERDGE
ncbi:MAG: DUF177 domain-containing protein [Chloroflexota bacterium]|nr:DUF177 domain-containing protein [Chloroflexota bacterium]